MTNITLTDALRRHFIGLDRVLAFAESAHGSPNYPPHNIIQTGPDSFRLTLAVAGFTRDEIEIVCTGDLLTVKGVKNHEELPEGWTFLHTGIASRDFSRQFRLAEFVEVEGAELENGLLTIRLERKLPEAQKPKRIPIV